MNNRITKITLTLLMLLVLAFPAQAFAAESNGSIIEKECENNNNPLYNKIVKQFTDLGSKLQIPQQEQQTVKKQAGPQTTAAPAKQAATPAKQVVQAPVAAPAKETAAPARQAAQTPAAAPAKQAVQAPASGNIGSYEQQVVDLVNKERAAAGLQALKVNTKLSGVAEKKAEDLRDNNYFDHQSPVYGSPFDMMKQFGIQYSAAGENIAKGQRTPADVMNGWMNSPGHRANILNGDFTEIGVGYVTDSNGGTYWVQHFIRP